jgi:acyl-CoA synthetase (AMP-forming)/AMP-acid ligase II
MRSVTLCEAFQASAVRVPERIALRTPADAVQLTWADYAKAVERVAVSLAALGVLRGDRVAFLAQQTRACDRGGRRAAFGRSGSGALHSLAPRDDRACPTRQRTDRIAGGVELAHSSDGCRARALAR